MLPLVDPYRYYQADYDGVTHRVLNALEADASASFKHLAQLQSFAQERKLELALGWASGQAAPVLVARQESQIDHQLTRVQDYLERENPHAAVTVPENLYIAGCNGQGGVCCDWKEAGRALTRLAGHQNVEAAIVTAATSERIKLPTPATLANVSFGGEKPMVAEAFKVFADWIYRVPVAPDSGKHFIPPQSQEISRARVDELTVGLPLQDFRQDHRRIWPALKAMRQLDLA